VHRVGFTAESAEAAPVEDAMHRPVMSRDSGFGTRFRPPALLCVSARACLDGLAAASGRSVELGPVAAIQEYGEDENGVAQVREPAEPFTDNQRRDRQRERDYAERQR